MLLIALVLILAASVYSVAKAPEDLRIKAVCWMVIPCFIGFVGVFFFFMDDVIARGYYGVAGAIAGWAVGALAYDSKRKKNNIKNLNIDKLNKM